MAKSPLPIRISPHALLATLVEVKYTLLADADIEQVLGAFQRALQPDFVYERELMELVERQTESSPEPLFYGKGVSIHLHPDHLIFNCISATNTPPPGSNGDYLGWNQYFEVVQDVIKRLHDTRVIAAFTGIAVRYVNALPGMQLNQQLQIQLPRLGPLPAPDSTFYRATFTDEQGFNIALMLTDRQQVPGQTELSSVFDITVRAETPQADLPALFARLDQAHTREKEVFFGLLDDEYLAQLEPVYAV